MSKFKEDVEKVGIIGAGVIGGGWALHFLRLGKQVTVWDPAAIALEKLRKQAIELWPTLEKMGLAPGATLQNLILVSSLEELEDVDVIQENAPEDLEAKQTLYATFDSVIPDSVPIISSTSGFAMTDIQARCTTAARTCVGHPFNPPYLVPFVEVVGGEHSSREVVDWADRFYTMHGKQVIKMEREVPGFIANRLQEALWREALHMVANGEATPEEIDDSIKYGPGLRWAIMGPCLTFHLAGGEGGMAHMLDHFGPSLEAPWTRLKAPELTGDLRARMIEGCEKMANGRGVEEIVRERDECLIRIMKVLAEYKKQNGGGQYGAVV